MRGKQDNHFAFHCPTLDVHRTNVFGAIPRVPITCASIYQKPDDKEPLQTNTEIVPKIRPRPLLSISYNSLLFRYLNILRCIAGVPNLLNIGAVYENKHRFRRHKKVQWMIQASHISHVTDSIRLVQSETNWLCNIVSDRNTNGSKDQNADREPQVGHVCYIV